MEPVTTRIQKKNESALKRRCYDDGSVKNSGRTVWRYPGFLYKSVYIEYLKGFEGLRMHYVDEEVLKMLTTFFCVCTANQRGATFTER